MIRGNRKEHAGAQLTKCKGKSVDGVAVPCKKPFSGSATAIESTYKDGTLLVGTHSVKLEPGGKPYYCGLRVPVDDNVPYRSRYCAGVRSP